MDVPLLNEIMVYYINLKLLFVIYNNYIIE
jgi:hypothetical protein